MAKRQKFEPEVLVPKEFSSLEEIDRAISKLNRRISELQALQKDKAHHEDPRVLTVTNAIRNSILEIFESNSPQWNHFQYFRIWYGKMYTDMDDRYIQKCFEDGIVHGIEELLGEIRGLEEKKLDFQPSSVASLTAPTTVHQQSPSTLKGQKGRCFVICPIGDEGSAVRKRSDILLKHLIEPVMRDFQYEVVRADKLPDPGKITEQIIERIATDDLVIADLTDNNANVFYELGVRHTIGKPVVQLIHKDGTIPFDVKGIRTIRYALEVDEVEKAKELLKDTVNWLMDNPSKPLIVLPQSG